MPPAETSLARLGDLAKEIQTAFRQTGIGWQMVKRGSLASHDGYTVDLGRAASKAEIERATEASRDAGVGPDKVFVANTPNGFGVFGFGTEGGELVNSAQAVREALGAGAVHTTSAWRPTTMKGTGHKKGPISPELMDWAEKNITSLPADHPLNGAGLILPNPPRPPQTSSEGKTPPFSRNTPETPEG